MPPVRGGPPWAMTEMIAAEPALAERLVRRLATDHGVVALVQAIRDAASRADAIVTTGCGTSEHAAMAIAALLADALRRSGLPAGRVAAVQAFELAGRPPASGLVIGVSHEGGTWATNLALERARTAGTATALITVGAGSPGARLADHLILTHEQDQSWCHTIGYLAPTVTGAVLAARVAAEEPDPLVVRALLDAADASNASAQVAGRLAECSRILVIGSGVDYVTARELALKIEEGAHLPAAALQLETVRHGHLAAADDQTGLILVLTDGEGRGGEVVERASSALRAARALGMRTAGLFAADLGDDVPRELAPAGRLAVPLAARLPRLAEALIGSAIPLQQLTERLARSRGTNPDPIGRDDPRHAAAGDA
jgi:glucosamine--fructose-6-phosphate aminotransferase (isomerizing)